MSIMWYELMSGVNDVNVRGGLEHEIGLAN